jgi:MYXO-CTERM domain-containing protein
MKKRLLQACAAALALLAVSAAAAATVPELGACGVREAGNAPGGESSPCIKVAVRAEPEGLRPAVMHATSVTPAKMDRRQPAQDDGLPEPGGWAMVLAGLLGALAIARRRVP